MWSKRPKMKLSHDEEAFLRHWMYDEVHYRDGQGPAKRSQLEHRAVPADLAVLIAAALPDLADQEAAGLGSPPAEPPTWPWSVEMLGAPFPKQGPNFSRGCPTDWLLQGEPEGDGPHRGRRARLSGARGHELRTTYGTLKPAEMDEQSLRHTRCDLPSPRAQEPDGRGADGIEFALCFVCADDNRRFRYARLREHGA